MTKLEQKLQELGYEKQPTYSRNQRVILYFKNSFNYDMAIYYDCKSNKIFDEGIFTDARIIRTQQHIDNLQKAFDVKQKDLKELELCQD